VRIAYDMETGDPDDALALCILADHPAVELAALTLNPGTREQVGIARRILERAGAAAVPVGARAPDREAGAVSAFHREWLGDVAAAAPDAPAHEVLAAALQADPATVLVSGAPLHNVRDLLRNHPGVRIERWVAQGGFAGDNVVPPELRLPKFAGRTMTESHNFGANKKATLAVLNDDRVRARDLVGKNVTHGVAWDAALQAQVRAMDGVRPGLRLAAEAMDVFLAAEPAGKLLHDPIAVGAAIDPSIMTWVDAEVTYRGGRWGSEPAPGSRSRVAVAVDRAALLRTLVAPAERPG
jgi:inosine-uridine nucleoside N-ribohydrolase